MNNHPTSSYALHIGCHVGFLKLLKRVRSNPKDSPMRRKKWRVRCTAIGCGTEFTIPQSYLVRKTGPKTHCGCQNKSDKTIYNREYRIWLMMNVRCNDPRHMAYKDYGGRGIQVAPIWAKHTPDAFTNFIQYVGQAPSLKHTLDRIAVNGNYEPGNIRWATPKEQAFNTRKAIAKREHAQQAKA